MKKHLIIVFLFLALINMNLSSQETELEETGKPVEFTLDIEEKLKFNSDSDFSVTGLILTNDIAGGLSIPVKFYTLSLWAEDEFELEWADTFALSALSNGLYFGLDNEFNIKDAVNILICYEQDIVTAPGTDVELSSVAKIGLSGGDYGIGLSWEIEVPCSFTYIPYESKEYQGSEVFKTFVIDEAYAGIDFEFFHFFALEEISGGFHISDTLTVEIPTSYDVTEQTKTITNEIEIGLDFDFYGFAPYIHLWISPENYINYSEEPDFPIFNLGLTTGFEYTIEWMTFGLDYMGQKNINLLPHDKPLWENEVEIWFLISLGS